MSILSKWGRKRSRKNSAELLYRAVVAAARDPLRFGPGGFDDTPGGRFDALLLQLSLIIRRLKSSGTEANRFLQELVGHFAQDMDRTVREAGVGDLGVGKKVKEMVTALYARAEKLENALEDEAAAPGKLDKFLGTHFLGGDDDGGAALAEAVQSWDAALTAAEDDFLLSGELPYGHGRGTAE